MISLAAALCTNCVCGSNSNEHQDFAEEIKRLRALRGKVKPKKGEGKRALKKL